jgi:type II secretory pathway component PulJ
MARRSRDRADRGFALPEVLISVVLMATISTVMVGIVSVVLRNAPTTSARADDARTLQGIVTWLPQDIDSTPPTGFDTAPGTASGCAVSPGTNLLRLQWSEWINGTTTQFVSNYRHVEVSPGVFRLQRITCSGAPEPTGGRAQNVSSDVGPIPTGWSPGNLPFRVAITREGLPPTPPTPDTRAVLLVAFEIQTIDGKIVRIDSAPKNPAATLPPTSLPSYIPPPPTTAVNAPPVADDVTVEAEPGVLTSVTAPASDPNGDPLTITVPTVPADWAVSVSGLVISVTPPATIVPPETHTFTYVADDGRGGTDTGTVTVNVVDVGTSTTTTTTTTTTTLPPPPPPCVIVSSTLNPPEMVNVSPDNNGLGEGGGVNVGVLRDPVTLTATTNEHCSGLLVRADTGASNGILFRNMVQTGPTSWTLQFPGKREGSSELWADGDRSITFWSDSGGPWSSTTLRIL